MAIGATRKKWDIKMDSKAFSCLNFGQVSKAIAQGLLNEDHLIRHNGLSGWRKAGEAEELKPFFQKLKKGGQ